MKNLTLLLFFNLSSVLIHAQTYSGKIIDGATSAPVEFASVALLQRADSALVAGAVTDSLGRFLIAAKEGDYLLKVSFLGYKTQFINVQNADIGEVTLLPDETVLQEVTVKGARPIIKMEKGGISTDIQHSMLKNMGNAADVLGQLPFVNR
ncbi:MAG: carboxypeptidase-like regulatory domain-containing protein, partial [Prevotellaceae bacterium]|nr:carboxypeptidase-like regulatory domain-containing protein [Prevotellaceae bacterium]